MTRMLDQLTIFGGNSNPDLTEAICRYVGLPCGRAEVFKFSNDNTFVAFAKACAKMMSLSCNHSRRRSTTRSWKC